MAFFIIADAVIKIVCFIIINVIMISMLITNIIPAITDTTHHYCHFIRIISTIIISTFKFAISVIYYRFELYYFFITLL